jgi:hypothetical protein
MTRFRELLKPGPRSTPKEDQERASQGLAAAVAGSNLRGWEGPGALPAGGECLVLAVAPYSQYDLTLLDLIDEALGARGPSRVPVYVVNLLDYDNREQVGADFPGLAQAQQTPLAAIWESGSPGKTAWGKQARDLVAAALGIPAEELSRRVKAESPGYANVVGQ